MTTNQKTAAEVWTDKDQLPYTGFLGHTFAILCDGDHGVRRTLGESCDLDSARQMVRGNPGLNAVIYHRRTARSAWKAVR